MGEKLYWVKRRCTNLGRSFLYTVIPTWLVREAMMYASRYIRDDEVVPDVTFLEVFARVEEKNNDAR
jgi:hypothetical protein